MILKGREIIDGGSITIPMDINVLDTTISIIKNGMNSKKPIINACFSSLVIKAGITISIPSSVKSSGMGKCDYKKQVHEEMLDASVAEVISKLVSNPKFSDLIRNKINMEGAK